MSREMKHSGIDWIGEIPKEWKTCRLKGIAHSLTKGNGITKEEVFPDGDTPCVRYGEIYSKYYGAFEKCISKTRKEILSTTRYFDCGDILFAGTGELVEEIGKNIVYLGRISCLAGGDIIILKHTQNPVFLNYALNSQYAQSQKSCGKAKLKVVHISSTEIGDIQVILPPLSEQQKIANYLDKVCGEVDEMITLQEQMIEELKAYKQSVITEAVTKGLNPNAPMKDSGIDWIGDVPEHWNVCKLKNIYQLLNGRAYLDPELLEEGKYRILRVGNLFSSDKWYYSDMELDDNKYCQSGDLLYGWSASIGPYIWEGEKVIYHYHIWKVLFGKNNLHFSYYLLYALTLAKQKDMHGSAMQHLTKTNMDNSFIALPPLSEQQSIASYLDEKCSEIDSLIALKQAKIEELKEYKKSVIYEYVTGKKEVV